MLDFLSVLNGEDWFLCYDGTTELESIVHAARLGVHGALLGIELTPKGGVGEHVLCLEHGCKAMDKTEDIRTDCRSV